MNDVNPALGEEMKEVVRHQIRSNDPPETKKTYDRLIKQGVVEDEVMRLLSIVVASEVFDVMKKGEPFNLERYIIKLDKLPSVPT
ncbi:MAG: hypothetical protein HN995_04995 [Candidatus Marinimicrobia bacterium]|jgi:hypothetical protein|nr:hypothetical protein [Candidatus Neomarinimicrobiota bacterium]MBT4420888.1 hypothetical protein [Candidatus Neomarinimicrobiota bacterium]MBT5785206.1 hypothetical protein [Candidatus Neomarinimicrobiota bacterium]MBT6946528.1 hypothetical protein [Candidatus Neomarinimicrobiota bacterium]MBT7577515.1 hypothetical protein [Candidatus Neomarinimicrobiota bacterium]